MSNKTPVILIRSLDAVRGGITKASITRANKLAEHYNEVIIVTMLFQQNYEAIIKDLKRKELLSKKVKVFNFFENMKPKKKGFKKIMSIKRRDKINDNKLISLPDMRFKKGLAYRYYSNGKYVMYKRYTKKNVLQFIDYLDASRHRYKREEYNEDGLLVRTRHMDNKLNKPRLDRYFDYNGKCYMTVWVNPSTNAEMNTVLFDNPVEYSNLNELKSEWLQSILNNIDEPVVMCEQRNLDRILWNITHDNIKKIGVVHASHLATPHIDIHKLEKGYARLFQNGHEYDQIIILTNEQKQDITNVYSGLNHLKVVPHIYQQQQSIIEKNKTVSNLAVTLARFHPDKQLDEAIKAFRFVVDKIPTAQYHIYGYGPERKKLLQLINDLNLENNVFLKKYTFNSGKVYQSASCSILTSKREGFGMVITESMAMGTPVVSFDTKYGPKDIIQDNVNGYIVPMGNKKELAERVIDIMTDKNIYKRLSNKALDVKETFSEKQYLSKWIKVIEN